VRRPAGDPADQILPVDGDQLDVVVAQFGQRLVAQPRQPVVGRQVRVADQPPEPGAPARRVEGGDPIGVADHRRSHLHGRILQVRRANLETLVAQLITIGGLIGCLVMFTLPNDPDAA